MSVLEEGGCWVHGCPEQGDFRPVFFHGAGCTDERPEGHGPHEHQHAATKARLCAGHRQAYEEQGFVPGLMLPDDEATYRKSNTPVTVS